MLVMMLLGVAFYTLVERRILGCFHIRIGPQRVGPMGLFQPFGDVVKLFLKRFGRLRRVDLFFWLISPFLAILFFLITVLVIRYGGGIFSFWSGLLYFFCVLAGRVYFLVWGGFFSGRKYSLLGAYRAVRQIISYEVILMFLLLGVCFLVSGHSFYELSDLGGVLILISPAYFVLWLVCCLAENNRLPFDFLEGESELVSGFNTEYWGGFFSFIFIFEYGYMVIFCVLTSLIFSGGLLKLFMVFFMLYFYLWIRATLPRSRYDFIMIFTWKKLLIVVMGVLCYLISLV